MTRNTHSKTTKADFERKQPERTAQEILRIAEEKRLKDLEDLAEPLKTNRDTQTKREPGSR